MGMCHWMGLYFHDLIGCNEVAFSGIFNIIDTKVGSHIFRILVIIFLVASREQETGRFVVKKHCKVAVFISTVLILKK